jgi:hypothetical protein
MTPLRRSLTALSLTLAAHAVGAVDRHTRPYPCVEHIHRVEPGLDAHLVIADLHCGAVDVVATRPRERRATVSTFAREYSAQIAINANFFEASTCGLAMGEGVVWRDAYADRCGASLGFAPGPRGTRIAYFDSRDAVHDAPFPWLRNVITGWPMLLRRGEVVFDPEEPIGMYRPHPRTMVGTTPGGQSLVLAVIDGRRAQLPGVTSLEMIPLMEEFGVADAMNLDGGGSSELWIESEGGVVNVPSDHRERSVVNHLGLRIVTR